MFHALSGVVASITVACYAFGTSFTQLAAVTVAHGLMEAVFSAQRTAVTFEFVDAEDMSQAVGR